MKRQPSSHRFLRWAWWVGLSGEISGVMNHSFQGGWKRSVRDFKGDIGLFMEESQMDSGVRNKQTVVRFLPMPKTDLKECLNFELEDKAKK